MILAIVGSRNGMDQIAFNYWLNYYLRKWGHPDKIVSGGAKGVDTMAKRFAEKNNISFQEFLPDAFLGRAGYLKRNTQIAEICTHCIAFPAKYSKGTWDTIRKVTNLKKKFKVIPID